MLISKPSFEAACNKFPSHKDLPKKKIGSVSVRENRHQSGGLLNLLGMTESFSSDFSG